MLVQVIRRRHGGNNWRRGFIAFDENVHLPFDVHGRGGTFKLITGGAISAFHKFLLLLASAFACFRPATENAVM